MKTIKCRCGKDIPVDDDVFDRLSDVTWRCGATAVFQEGSRNTASMPHFIIAVPPGFMPDHKDRDFHYCLRANLRLATRSQNAANSKKRSDNTTGYRGVSYSTPTKNWEYRLTKDGKTFRYRGFATARDAAIAYNKKAKEVNGEFAYQNEIA